MTTTEKIMNSAAVRMLLEQLPTIPNSKMIPGMKDQLLIFEWLIRLQQILDDQVLPPDLHVEVITAIEGGNYFANTPLEEEDEGTLIELGAQNANHFLFWSLRDLRGINPSQVLYYKRWILDTSRAHVLDYPEYAGLKALLA